MNTKTIDGLSKALTKTGLLQFGYFADQPHKNAEIAYKPYQWHFEMLPAYPDILIQVKDYVWDKIHPIETLTDARLVATQDITPIGIALAIQHQISLVYSEGCGRLPAYDFIGAYDVGHPAYLLVGEFSPHQRDLLDNLKNIGLVVHKIVPIIGIEDEIQGIPIAPMMTWDALLASLSQQSFITDYQAQAILDSLQGAP